MKIAIVGSTGQIGRSLGIHAFGDGHKIHLYSRSKGNIPVGFVVSQSDYPTDLDMIINCVGNGDPKTAYDLVGIEDYLAIDSHILKYLTLRNPDCHYVYISSWVADQTAPRNKNQENYAVYKRFFEIRHEIANRTLNNRITDVRVRSFFSRFIKLYGGFLVAAMIRHILYKEPFTLSKPHEPYSYTTPRSLWREILHGVSTNQRIINPTSIYTTRECLYYDLKEYITTGNKFVELSDEFQYELSELLGMAHAEKVNTDVIGTVSFDYEEKEIG